MNSEYTPLISVGYSVFSLPEPIFNSSKIEAEKLINSNFRSSRNFKQRLVGAIEHEYAFTSSTAELNKFFEKVVPQYWKAQNNFYEAERRYNILRSSDGSPTIWMNFQKKGEYNPIHGHNGKLSFVYWVRVPYSLEDEAKLPHIQHSSSYNGPCFNFHYSSPEPTPPHIHNYTLKIDKSWEGKIIIFPAWLQHSVNPFYTSDDYRISIAGNLAPID